MGLPDCLPFQRLIQRKGQTQKRTKKRGHHKLPSKLASLPNATCLPIVWGLPLLRGEKNMVFQMPLTLQSLPLIGLWCSALPLMHSAHWVSSISLSQQHLTALCMDLYYCAFYLIFTLLFYLPLLWGDECLDCKDSTVFLCNSVPTVKGMALAKGWVFVK